MAASEVWDVKDSEGAMEDFERALTEEEEGELPVFIVHSSGSTGFPKVCYCSSLLLIM